MSWTLLVELLLLVVEAGALVLLVAWTRRKGRVHGWPRWYPVAPVASWVSAFLAIVTAGPRSLDEEGVGVSLVLGAGALALWGVIFWQQRSWVNFTLSKTGGRLPRPGEPTCKEDGNAADGTCERCGDWVCPACVKIASTTKARYCYGCAEKVVEGN